MADIRAEIRALENNEGSDTHISALEAELEEMELNIEEEVGLRQLNSDGNLIQPFNSTAGDVSVTTIDLWEDLIGGSGDYVAEVDWEWTNSNWGSSMAGTGEVGGEDAVTVGFNQTISLHSNDISLYSSSTGEDLTHTASVNRERIGDGFAWSYQDEVLTDEGAGGELYNAGSGNVRLQLDFPNGIGESVEMYFNKAHTWSSAGVTGFSVSTSGIGFEFSSQDDYWQDSVNDMFYP